jgi:HEAT repeat protein
MTEQWGPRTIRAMTGGISILFACSLLAAGGAAAAQQQPASAQLDSMRQQQAAASHGAFERPSTIRQRAWQTLHEGLKEKSADKRAKAVNALGLLAGNAEAESAAREALQDDKYIVRIAAATALGSMHAVRSIPQLEAALEDQEPTVVLASANSLLLLEDRRSAYSVYYGVLTGTVRPSRGLIHENLRTLHDTRKMAELGIEQGIGFVPFAGFGHDVVKTVMKSESDSSPVRAAAAKKLAHDPDPVSAEAPVAATRDGSWMVRAAALEAIAQRGDHALLLRVTPLLEESKDDVRYTAASCVIRLSARSCAHATPRNGNQRCFLPAG